MKEPVTTWNNILIHHELFDHSPFPMWIQDQETHSFLAVNNQSLQLYGFTRSQFLKMTLNDLSQDSETTKKEISLSSAKNSTEHVSIFQKHRKKDGEVFPVMLSWVPIDYAGGKAELVTCIDLSDLGEIQQSKENLEKYLKVINQVGDLFLSLKKGGRHLEKILQTVGRSLGTDRLYFLFKHQKGSFNSIGIQQWVEDSHLSQFTETQVQSIYSALTSYKPKLTERKQIINGPVSDLSDSTLKRILIDSGTVSTLIIPILTEDGSPWYLGVGDNSKKRIFSTEQIAILRLLAAYLNLEVNKQDLSNQLSCIVNRDKIVAKNTSELHSFLDSTWNYQYASISHLNLLGYNPSELYGTSWLGLVFQEDRGGLSQKLKEVKLGNKVTTEPYRILNKQGELRWFRTELSKIQTNSWPNSISAISRDITELMLFEYQDKILNEIELETAKSTTLEELLQRSTECLLRLPEISTAEVWLLSPNPSYLSLTWKASKARDQDLLQYYSPTLKCRKGEGLPGKVWKNQQVIIIGGIYKG